jgi:hypothetical protein
MRRRAHHLVLTLAATASLAGLAGCSESGVSATDAYQIGCPALDAAIGTGAVGTKAAVSGLQKLREQPGLNEQTSQWLDTAVAALKSTDPEKIPADAKARLIDGCTDNGYPLRNLTKG